MAGAISTSYFTADLRQMINDLYTTVTGLGSNAVSASITDLSYATDLEVGGEVIRVSQSLVVDYSSVSVPQIGSVITIGGVGRMIANFSTSPDAVSYTIDIADQTT
jgi:hypothetical protein